MDAATTAFLVLLAGSSAEHVIEMPSIDDCHRAAEYVTQAQCMNSDQYDAHLAAANAAAASQSVPPELAPGGALLSLPSATQRRLRNVLNPTPAPTTVPVRRSGAQRNQPSSSAQVPGLLTRSLELARYRTLTAARP